MLRRHRTFAGGIDLPDEKARTLDAPVATWRGSRRIRVPLARPGRPPARLTIALGEAVSAGEKIAETPDGSEAVHSPCAGRLAGETTADVAVRDGFDSVEAAEIADVSPPASLAPLAGVYDWRDASSDDLRERLTGGGVLTADRPCEPIGGWVRRARERRAGVLIANAMENRPYVTSVHRLMVEHGPDVIRGLAILARAIEADEVYIAADRRRVDAYRQMVGPARMYGIERVALSHKYPTGSPPILAGILTGRETPPGGTPMDVGAAVVDPATCLAVCRWVACDQPHVSRVVTVAGEGAERRGNFHVPFGTPVADLAGRTEEVVVVGGPMTGRQATEDAVVTASTDAVLVLNPPNLAPPGPCIRCGWCTDHCPVRLNVSALNDEYELGQIDRARRAGVMACVGCGVCSYVCPARLPLTERVKRLQRAVLRRREATADANGGAR